MINEVIFKGDCLFTCSLMHLEDSYGSTKVDVWH